nr:MFS transporter [Neobacillus terrae]
MLRIPIGYWTNKYGARVLFLWSFVILLIPIAIIYFATSLFTLLIGEVLLGVVGGALFSVGVTSLPKYYPKEKQGLINGIYGSGNIGTALTAFIANLCSFFWLEKDYSHFLCWNSYFYLFNLLNW